jgi:hypothetical protein
MRPETMAAKVLGQHPPTVPASLNLYTLRKKAHTQLCLMGNVLRCPAEEQLPHHLSQHQLGSGFSHVSLHGLWITQSHPIIQNM